ncbi:MAG: sensor domain-containing diguanylate cyclase [Elusimicrobia bacterium]|nr:sensor domain-containing diguanylate cyclase [Elusimicrobiota bacterium]
MFDYRFVTLLGATLVFAPLSVLFIFASGLGPSLFPLYGLIFLWCDFRREAEAHVIFLFMVTTAGAVLAAAVAPHRAVIAAEIAGMWALVWALGLHHKRGADVLREARLEMAGFAAAIRDDESELARLRAYQASASVQMALRRDLTESARSLGSTLDGREVHVRLAGILTSRFPGSRVRIQAWASGDPLLGLAQKSGAVAVVKDSAADPRLAAARGADFRSGMAAPLKVMRQAAGFVKVESDCPGAFGSLEAQALDLITTMASLSLENIRLYEAVQEAATHDALTGLLSHRAFQARLHEELLRAGRSQTPVSFVLGDIDHFKTYNDRYGHQAGDSLLRSVSAILSSFARPVDFPARYGGEEFCLILPNVGLAEALDLAERIRARIESETFVFQGVRTGATMSFGVSSFPQDATTSSQTVRVADERLYRAKAGGRNRVVGV